MLIGLTLIQLLLYLVDQYSDFCVKASDFLSLVLYTFLYSGERNRVHRCTYCLVILSGPCMFIFVSKAENMLKKLPSCLLSESQTRPSGLFRFQQQKYIILVNDDGKFHVYVCLLMYLVLF